MKGRNKEKIIPFGALAQAWRERCGIDRVEFARRTGTEYNYVYSFETGRRNSITMLSVYIMAGFDPVYEMTRKDKDK